MPDLDFMDGTARLVGSRDPATGQTYFPFRALAADGSLTPCEWLALSPTGVLAAWTSFGRRFFGQVDLPDGVRVQTLLMGEPHEVGAAYVLVTEQDGDGPVRWGFSHAA